MAKFFAGMLIGGILTAEIGFRLSVRVMGVQKVKRDMVDFFECLLFGRPVSYRGYGDRTPNYRSYYGRYYNERFDNA